jgi:2,5-diamino-6-hydroxy-4-(5-phosphoribosylamino)pyrimidine 1'-reductase
MTRPYVVINVAATLDGKIDTVERRGATISSARDKQRVDELRASVDAVMVGSRTLLDEDPRLTVRSDALRAERLARGLPENPAKVGVLSRLGESPDAPSLPPHSRFLTAGPARIILFGPLAGISEAERVSLQARGVEIFPIGGGRVDLMAAMATLSNLGIKRVLVEGGGTLNFALLQLGLVDEVQVFVAPLMFGGATAPTLADGGGGLGLRLRRCDVEAWEDGGVLLRYIVEPR